MRFELIMNMPTTKGVLIQRWIVEHPSPSLEVFIDELTEFDFVIVEEFFPDETTKSYKSHGFAAVNCRYIGKVKQWER